MKDGGVGVLPATVCKNRALMRQLGKGEVGGGGREREGEGFLEEMASSGTLKITIVPEEEGEMWKGPVDNGNRKGWLSSLDLGRRHSLREK